MQPLLPHFLEIELKLEHFHAIFTLSKWMTFEAPECQTFSRYDNYGPYYVQNSLRFLNKGWETRLTRWIHSATSLFSRGHVSGKTVAFRVVMALSTKKQFSGSNKVNSNKDSKSDLQSSLMNLPRTKISLWYDVGVLIKKRDCTIREFFLRQILLQNGSIL